MAGQNVGSRAAQRVARAREAARALSRVDRRMAAIVRRFGPHRPVLTNDPFVSLASSIVQQQISMSAARAIWQRLVAQCARRRLTPEGTLALSLESLRAVGLSRQKSLYVHDLSAHFADGRLTRARLRRAEDEQVIEVTTQVKGVGRWTAQMLLMFCLERPDVWPVDDLGLRKAVRDFHRLAELPDKRHMEEAGDAWRPFRTYASWYLWRSLEGPLMPGVCVASDAAGA